MHTLKKLTCALLLLNFAGPASAGQISYYNCNSEVRRQSKLTNYDNIVSEWVAFCRVNFSIEATMDPEVTYDYYGSCLNLKGDTFAAKGNWCFNLLYDIRFG